MSGTTVNWQLCALLSALFAGVTAILAKVGVDGVPSNVATLVRTMVILVIVSLIVLATGEGKAIKELTTRNWTFLALSGVATGLSWLFYFAAIKAGPVSRVAPIDKLSFVIAAVAGVGLLHETMKPAAALGVGFIVVGVLLTLK